MPRYPVSPDACRDAYLKAKLSDFPTEATTRFYKETINVITNALISGGRNPLPYKITKEDVIWLFGTLWKDREVSTKIGYKCVLNKYTRHFNNPVMDKVKLKFPHDMRPNADWLTPEQSKLLVEYEHFNPLQKVVIYLMMFCGLRRIECIRLTLDQIYPDYLDIRGKGALGGKPRIVPMNAIMRNALDEYLAWREEKVCAFHKRCPSRPIPNNLLIWIHGRHISAYSEKGDGLDRMVVRKVSKALGFPFSNHTLRRTFARTLYMNGKKLRTIANLLGEESEREAEKYIGIIKDDMSEAVECLTY